MTEILCVFSVLILIWLIAHSCFEINKKLDELKELLDDPSREKVCFWRVINTGYFISDCGMKRHKEMGPTPHCSWCGGRVVVDGIEEKGDA